MAQFPFLHAPLGTQRINQLKVSTGSKKMRTVSGEAMGSILPAADVPPGGDGGNYGGTCEGRGGQQLGGGSEI